MIRRAALILLGLFCATTIAFSILGFGILLTLAIRG